MDHSNCHSSTRLTANTTSSLLEELGGQKALDALVGAFYFNVLNDERLGHFFARSDTNAIRNHQRKFLAFALGGENEYRGRSLSEAHRSLVDKHGLDDTHFDAITEILTSIIHQFGHPGALNQKIVNRVNALRADVLGTNR